METGLTKSVNSPFSPGGVYIGLVKRIDYDVKKVWVQIGRLAGKKSFGPLMVVGTMPDVGSRVACMFTEANEIIVVGVIQQVASSLPVAQSVFVSEEPPSATHEGQQWYDLNTGSQYISLDNGGGVLVWVETGGTGAQGPPGEPGDPLDVTDLLIPGELEVDGATNLDGYTSVNNDLYVENTLEVIGNTTLWGNVNGAPLYPALTAIVAATETTIATSYVDLTTVGPSLSVTVPVAGVYRVTFGALMRRTVGSGSQSMTVDISGATSNAAGSTTYVSSATGGSIQLSTSQPTTPALRAMIALVYLNAGSNTILCKYASSASTTAEFSSRFLTVQRVT